MRSVLAIGKELKEAHDRLANNKSGTFGKWTESLGISRMTANRYIGAYDFIVTNCDNIEAADNIQPSLLFELSKPSAPQELQEKVLSGDITTHKEYKELEAKLKNVERTVDNLESLKSSIEEQNRILARDKQQIY